MSLNGLSRLDVTDACNGHQRFLVQQLQENGLKGFGEVLKRFDDELG